jgi:23S rRNA (pseudouridine1915-N3)-methyltransferase
MMAALPPKAFIVALQVKGKSLSSEQLAEFLQARSRDGRDIAFLIGGPDGIAPELDAKADLRWSLSALTLPHALARVVVAEALYRAVTIVKGHPYHRA